jgi:hypothetical protein
MYLLFNPLFAFSNIVDANKILSNIHERNIAFKKYLKMV